MERDLRFKVYDFINKVLTEISKYRYRMSQLALNSWRPSQIFSSSRHAQTSLNPLQHQLSFLRKQSKLISNQFEEFKEETINMFNQAMGRILSFIQRDSCINAQLREELDIVKHSNQNMCRQVMQLREMINDCVKSYNSELELKDAQIRELKMQLGIDVEEKYQPEGHEQQDDKINNLEVIQEVSEYTGSCLQSIREISIPNSAKGSAIPIATNESIISNSREDSWAEDDRDKVNKSKSFLHFFRKTVDESIALEQEKQKEMEPPSSAQDLHLAQIDKINIPKTIRSPKNMQFLKKSAKIYDAEEKENNQYIDYKRTPHRRNYSEGDDKSDNKSMQKHNRSQSKAGSKQKIKITSKMLDQSNSFVNKHSRKSSMVARPSVHLGGKAHLKKIIKEVKTALQEFKVWQGFREKEVVYEGEKKNGTRWGKGKLLYTNGFQYEGSFAQNYKHGVGTVSLNGIAFYEGQWSLDEISGQGYIKSLKNYSEHCPKQLAQASYCGQLLENRMHGMGTLFLNQSQKIVCKFVQGIPVGDFTYYNRSQIEFGSWY